VVPLTLSHAVKGDRRYRYYVSCSLTKGPAARVNGGWRLPVAEIEPSIQSRSLFGVVEFGGAAGLLAEGVVDISQGSSEHSPYRLEISESAIFAR
jgi:hypothetical protein